MKRSNWKKLMDQFNYIHESDEGILDALDAGDSALYGDLCREQNGKTDALFRMVMEVLEDEKDSLTD